MGIVNDSTEKEKGRASEGQSMRSLNFGVSPHQGIEHAPPNEIAHLKPSSSGSI
jgi:hypothetical protein